MEYNSTALDWFSTKRNKQNWYPANTQRNENAHILNSEHREFFKIYLKNSWLSRYNYWFTFRHWYSCTFLKLSTRFVSQRNKYKTLIGQQGFGVFTPQCYDITHCFCLTLCRPIIRCRIALLFPREMLMSSTYEIRGLGPLSS